MSLLGEAEGGVAVGGDGFTAEGGASPGGVCRFTGEGVRINGPFVVKGEDGEFGGLANR